jgi:signal transduction histidine kinase
VVLYSFFFRDKNGRFFEYDDGARMVAESTTVPVYCLWDFSMNSGMVGGHLVCGYLQGLHAGEMALDILRGKPVAEVPVKYQPPLRYIFDYEALKRFGIPEDELPADRVLINRPLTLYAEYKRYFWGVVIGFPLMAAVILVLGHFLRRSRLAEAALRESQTSLAKARNMLQSVMDGASETAIIATDCEGIIRLFNEGAVRLLGYDAEEMVGQHTPEVLFRREELAARAVSLSAALGVAVDGFRALVQPAEAIGFERREWDCVRKDGRVVVVSVITTVLREEGEAISGYLMVARDVTERKKSEQALEQVRIYISNVIDAMPSWLIGVEEGGRVMQWNLTAARESGIELKHAFGRPVDELLPFMRQQMVLVREALEAREVASALKIPVEKGDLTEYVNLTVYPLLGEGLTGAVLRIDNVTEQMKLEQRMIQSQKMDAIGQLAGGVAHDFNNLLGGILGFSEILERHVDEQGRHYVELMNSAAKRAADLTAKLLSFSRKGQLTRTPVDMHGLVHNTVGLLKRCLNKQVELSVQLNAPYCTVMGDEAQLHSALLNLGINAGHAMPNGGELLYASRMIELDRNHCAISPFNIEPGKYLEIEVRDHGVGISEEHIGHIFEPFYTTRSAGEGTGLGLAAVYGAVQEHKGAITVYSEVGVGTVFHLYFPLIKIEVGRVNSEEHPVKGEGRILVVDDEAVIRMTAEAILSGLGYEVSLARNGEEALEAYRAAGQEIDLVLLDMIMPGMNGHEVFDRLKDMDPAVKVLVCSGYSKPDDLRAMQARGCSGFIRKPYTTLELSRQVASCLFD